MRKTFIITLSLALFLPAVFLAQSGFSGKAEAAYAEPPPSFQGGGGGVGNYRSSPSYQDYHGLNPNEGKRLDSLKSAPDDGSRQTAKDYRDILGLQRRDDVDRENERAYKAREDRAREEEYQRQRDNYLHEEQNRRDAESRAAGQR